VSGLPRLLRPRRPPLSRPNTEDLVGSFESAQSPPMRLIRKLLATTLGVVSPAVWNGSAMKQALRQSPLQLLSGRLMSTSTRGSTHQIDLARVAAHALANWRKMLSIAAGTGDRVDRLCKCRCRPASVRAAGRLRLLNTASAFRCSRGYAAPVSASLSASSTLSSSRSRK
jgi:hypothetical protein